MIQARRLAGFVAAALLLAPIVAAADGQAPSGGARRAPERPTTSAPAAAAQSQTTSGRRADFLFGAPRGAVGVRGSWLFAAAGSDLFDFVTHHLTLDKGDFNAPGVAADLAIALTPRLDVQAGFEVNRAAQPSEYRNFVDNNLRPIEQVTRLKTVHLLGSVRYTLTPRGHQVSRLAYIPSRLVPYVGAGAGAMYYLFEQHGDFVDFVDLRVFGDSFRSRGWTPAAHAFAGVDVQLHRSLYGTVQGRYTRAAAPLGSDFVGFAPIDLSGFHVSAGINVLF